MKGQLVAKLLLDNTKDDYLKKFISIYISEITEGNKVFEEPALNRFHNCIDYIANEKFDIKGWQLFEIPVFYAHCFRNEMTNERFDLSVWDIGKVVPRYLDDNCNEQDAKTIQEAIIKYCV